MEQDDRVMATFDITAANILTLQQGDDMVAMDWGQISSLYILIESLMRDARIK
jgi:hypothetical protein